MDLNNIQEFIKNKRYLIIASVLVLFLIVLILLSSLSKTRPSPGTQPPQPNQQIPQSDSFSTSSEYQSEEVQQAIAEQLKVDQEYADWNKNISDSYPWRKKLPLTSEKYYVYFDLGEKVFIGRLYPLTGDDVEKIKTEIIRRLREEKGIPTEDFTFSWTVFSK